MNGPRFVGILLAGGAGVALYLWYRAVSQPAPVYWDTVYSASVRPRVDVAGLQPGAKR